MDNGKYFTFTEEDEYPTDKIISCLDPKVLKALRLKISEFEDEMVNSMCGCQSPIEQLLAVSLHSVINSPYRISRAEALGIDIIGVEPQCEIECGNKTYKVDFEIPVWNTNTKEGKCFVVECDGHDFHEKTKEQVQKDKERERDLIKIGRIVIRYSGSEIYKDADECAREVCDIIFHHFENESR
jgi:hypothetical protein